MKNRLPEAAVQAKQIMGRAAERLRKMKQTERLYYCERCKSFYLLDHDPDSCPKCRRKYFDQVKDLDTGEVQGGGISFREATKAEKTRYALQKRREKEKKKHGQRNSPLEALIQSEQIGGDGNIAVVIMQMPDDQ